MPRLAVLALLVVLAAFIGGARADSTVPEGTPYIIANISCPTGFDDAVIRSRFAAFIRTTFPNSMANIVAANVQLYDAVPNITGDVTQVSITILRSFANNARAYLHLEGSLPYFAANTVFGTPYSTTAATLVENPSTLVIATYASTFSFAYNGTESPAQLVSLDFSPARNTFVELTLTNPNVIVTPHPIRIMWPNLQATFTLLSNTPGTYAFTGAIGSTNDTTPSRVYTLSVLIPQFRNSYRENVTITPPPRNLITYQNTWSDNFEIRVPASYRDPTLRAVLGIFSDFALEISPRNISLVQRNVGYNFRVRGVAGTYTLRYVIDAPWSDSTRDNRFFYSPTITTVFTIEPSLNVTLSQFPEAFMVNPPAHSQYGGAYSIVLPVHLQRPPKRNLRITMTSPSVIFEPPFLDFSSTRSFLTFRARALTIEVHVVHFEITGDSKDDYLPIPNKNWVVRGPNPRCLTNVASGACWSMAGCLWNEDLNLCSNRTLPIRIGNIPMLFDEEPSKEVTIRLPTRVRNGLTIEFMAAARLVFNPSRITLPIGANEFNFTVTGFLDPTEARAQQFYYLRLTGVDANTYDQQRSYAFIRSKIKCNVTRPANFFVTTESDEFFLACDSAPETDVLIRPRSTSGIAFVPLGSTQGNAMFLDSTMSTGRFFAISTTDRTGTFPITFQISGTNAARYDVIPTVNIMILPSGQVLTPPTFYQTAFEESKPLSMDITVVSPKPLQVSISLRNADWSNATTVRVEPAEMIYNNTLRGFLRVYGTVPGKYYMVFNISGANSRNYIEPKPMHFFIMDRLDGSAFTARLGVGFVPAARCRVNVGRNSEIFRGQAPIDAETSFCTAYKPPAQANATYNCSQHATEERCRTGLAESGFICVWHTIDSVPQCIHLPQLQGIVKDVAYGSRFTLLLDIWGGVWSIGSTRYGQLGHYNDFLDRVPLPENVSQIVAGTSHSLALAPSGVVYAWGVNARGQLGINSKVQQTEVPTRVVFPRGENITCISVGTVHSTAVSLSGRIFTWGANDFGQLGSEATYRSESRIPTAIGRDLFNGEPVLAAQCGEYHTMVATDIQVYTFGSNFMGQLGRPGFDEWKPKPPVHWVLNRFRGQPAYRSFITGLSECARDNA